MSLTDAAGVSQALSDLLVAGVEHTIISLLLFCRYRPNGRDGARKQRFGLAVRCDLLAQQFVHGLLIGWSSALHFAEEAVDEVRRPLSCR